MTKFHLAMVVAVIVGAASGPLVSRTIVPQILEGSQVIEPAESSNSPLAPEVAKNTSGPQETASPKPQEAARTQSPGNLDKTAGQPTQEPRPTEGVPSPNDSPVVAARSSQSSTTEPAKSPSSRTNNAAGVQWSLPARGSVTAAQSDDVASELASVSRTLNAGLPRMVTAEARLDTTIPGPNRLTYVYTLVKRAKKDVDIAQLRRIIRSQVVSTYKSSDAMKGLREHNIELQYRYKDKYGTFFFELAVSPRDF